MYDVWCLDHVVCGIHVVLTLLNDAFIVWCLGCVEYVLYGVVTIWLTACVVNAIYDSWSPLHVECVLPGVRFVGRGHIGRGHIVYGLNNSYVTHIIKYTTQSMNHTVHCHPDHAPQYNNRTLHTPHKIYATYLIRQNIYNHSICHTVHMTHSSYNTIHTAHSPYSSYSMLHAQTFHRTQHPYHIVHTPHRIVHTPHITNNAQCMPPNVNSNVMVFI